MRNWTAAAFVLGLLALLLAPAALAGGLTTPTGLGLAEYQRGMDALERKLYDEAIAAFTRAARHAPTASQITFSLGVACLRADRPTEARTYLQRATREAPDSQETWEGLALACQRLGDRTGAADALARAAALRGASTPPPAPRAPAPTPLTEAQLRAHLQVKPADTGARLALAGRLADRKDYAGAAAQLELATKYAPKMPELWADLAGLQEYLGRLPEATTAYKRALALKKEPAWQRSLGYLLCKRELYDHAIAYLQAAVPAFPADGRLRAALGLALMQTDHLDQALPHLREATRLAPKEAGYWQNLAAALATKQQHTEAAAALDKSIALDNHNLKLRLMRERLRLQAGSPSKASIPYLQAMAKDFPTDPRPQTLLVDLYLEEKQFTPARAIITALLGPAWAGKVDRHRLLQQRAWSWQGEGKLEEARADYLRAFQERTFDPLPVIRAARTLLNVGKVDEAIALYDEVLRGNPKCWPELALEVVTLQLEQKRYEDAINRCQMVIAGRPELVRARELLAEAYDAAGDAPGAVEVYRGLLALRPQHGVAQVRVAAAEVINGRTAEAERLYLEGIAHTLATQQAARPDITLLPDGSWDLQQVSAYSKAQERYRVAIEHGVRGVMDLGREHPERLPAILLVLEKISTDYPGAETITDTLRAHYSRTNAAPQLDALYRRLLEQRKDDITLRMAYGDFLTQQGRPVDAKTQYEAVLKQNPNHAGARAALGLPPVTPPSATPSPTTPPAGPPAAPGS